MWFYKGWKTEQENIDDLSDSNKTLSAGLFSMILETGKKSYSEGFKHGDIRNKIIWAREEDLVSLEREIKEAQEILEEKKKWPLLALEGSVKALKDPNTPLELRRALTVCSEDEFTNSLSNKEREMLSDALFESAKFVEENIEIDDTVFWLDPILHVAIRRSSSLIGQKDRARLVRLEWFLNPKRSRIAKQTALQALKNASYHRPIFNPDPILTSAVRGVLTDCIERKDFGSVFISATIVCVLFFMFDDLPLFVNTNNKLLWHQTQIAIRETISDWEEDQYGDYIEDKLKQFEKEYGFTSGELKN